MSASAIPIERDAGPKPMQRRSNGSEEVPGESWAAMSREVRAWKMVGSVEEVVTVAPPVGPDCVTFED